MCAPGGREPRWGTAYAPRSETWTARLEVNEPCTPIQDLDLCRPFPCPDGRYHTSLLLFRLVTLDSCPFIYYDPYIVPLIIHHLSAPIALSVIIPFSLSFCLVRQPNARYIMPATSSLLSLPVDVLFVIRDAISSAPFTSTDPGLGLLAHLSLSQTSRRLRDVYTFSTGESDDLFWKRACVMAGYGRPMRREYPQSLPGATLHDTPTPEVFTWKQIAHIITTHKRVCEIRSCRNASCWPGALRFPPIPPHLPFPTSGNLSPSHATPSLKTHHSHPSNHFGE